MKISYNWLKWYIPDAPEVKKLADIITYHLAEVESIEEREDGDAVLDIKILPNRAHDLLSHQGIAHEVASLLNIKFVDPAPKYKIPESKKTDLKIDVQTNNCRRYMGRIVRNVKVGPSPDWVVKHLEAIGQRSINNIVDAANLVMFDSGQPVHAFDLDKMENEKIIIRMAKKGEKITLLTGEEKELNEGNMIIADERNVLGVAGIKGGKIPEVDESTKNIILEIANFNPTVTRKSAQALNVFTDARKCFENDLSPELGDYAMRELSGLIFEIFPDAIFEDVVDIYPEKQKEKKLSFRIEKLISILGMLVTVEQVKEILVRYNFSYTEKEGVFEVIIPSWRLDLEIEEDMAEEIGRILGYKKLGSPIPKINFKPKPNELYNQILFTRNKLLAEGYSEVMSSTFRNKGEIEVLASASDKNFLRTDLTEGIKESLKLNQINSALLGLDEVRVFEIGTVFTKKGEEIHVAYGNKKEVKEVELEDYTKSASLDASAQVLGSPGPQPRPDRSHKHASSAFKMWPLFPFIARDIAVWVPEKIESLQVSKVIKDNMGDMVVRGPELFDEFKKDGKISYAFLLIFQSFDRTLTDAEINEIMEKITSKIKENNDWQVR